MANASTAHSEWLTRKKLIDPMLKAAGWRVVPHVVGKPLVEYDRCAIEEYPTDSGPADYALCVDGQILGFIDAKNLLLKLLDAQALKGCISWIRVKSGLKLCEQLTGN